MNYIILDIIESFSLSQQIKNEIESLLIWQELHSAPPFSLYSLHHDFFSCIFNTAKTFNSKQVLLASQISFKSQDCVIRPVLRACINSCDASLSLIYISNNPKRWTEDIANKCKAYFLVPLEGHSTYSVQQVFSSIFPIIIPVDLAGSLVFSNESKIENGVSFEIQVSLHPVILPLMGTEKISVELQMERLIRKESLGVEFLYGNSWIINSNSDDFFCVCASLAKKKLVLVCSSLADLDFVCNRDLPCFYALFPAIDLPHMLLQKVASKEYAGTVSLAPVRLFDYVSEINEFVFVNNEVRDLDPLALNSGLFELICDMGKNEKIEAVKGFKYIRSEPVTREKRSRKPKKF